MARLPIYLILIGLAVYCLYLFLKPGLMSLKPNIGMRFRKPANREGWVQVYETASQDEAQHIQSRLQEEGIECIVYQQGKKDIHGNPLRGIGIAVPKSSAGLAQKIISRIPA